MRVSSVSRQRMQNGWLASGGNEKYDVVTTAAVKLRVESRMLANAMTVMPLQPPEQSPPPEFMFCELMRYSTGGADAPNASVKTGSTVSMVVPFTYQVEKPAAVTVLPASISFLSAPRVSAYIKFVPVESNMLAEK